MNRCGCNLKIPIKKQRTSSVPSKMIKRKWKDIKAKSCGLGDCYWISKWFSIMTNQRCFEIVACAYLAKLPEQLDEGALTKRVGEAGMESQSGVLLGQNSYPPFLVQHWVETKSQSHNVILWQARHNHSNQMGDQRWTCGTFLTVTQVGMRSHLFRTKMRCFQGFSFFKYVSMLLERVPMGSRASSTWMMTSDESITY